MNFFKWIGTKTESMLSMGGKVSIIRVISFITAMVILSVYTAQNIVAMIKCGGYSDFPANTVLIMLVVLGAKVGQSIFGEKNTAAISDISAPSAEQPIEEEPTTNKAEEVQGGGPG